jgi:hypothetical protein
MISEEININRETVQLTVMEDLGINKVCEEKKTVPKNLRTTNCSGRWNRVLIFCNELRLANGRIESSLEMNAKFFQYNLEPKWYHMQCKPPGSRCSNKERAAKSEVKKM